MIFKKQNSTRTDITERHVWGNGDAHV